MNSNNYNHPRVQINLNDNGTARARLLADIRASRGQHIFNYSNLPPNYTPYMAHNIVMLDANDDDASVFTQNTRTDNQQSIGDPSILRVYDHMHYKDSLNINEDVLGENITPSQTDGHAILATSVGATSITSNQWRRYKMSDFLEPTIAENSRESSVLSSQNKLRKNASLRRNYSSDETAAIDSRNNSNRDRDINHNVNHKNNNSDISRTKPKFRKKSSNKLAVTSPTTTSTNTNANTLANAYTNSKSRPNLTFKERSQENSKPFKETQRKLPNLSLINTSSNNSSKQSRPDSASKRKSHINQREFMSSPNALTAMRPSASHPTKIRKRISKGQTPTQFEFHSLNQNRGIDNNNQDNDNNYNNYNNQQLNSKRKKKIIARSSRNSAHNRLVASKRNGKNNKTAPATARDRQKQSSWDNYDSLVAQQLFRRYSDNNNMNKIGHGARSTHPYVRKYGQPAHVIHHNKLKSNPNVSNITSKTKSKKRIDSRRQIIEGGLGFHSSQPSISPRTYQQLFDEDYNYNYSNYNNNNGNNGNNNNYGQTQKKQDRNHEHQFSSGALSQQQYIERLKQRSMFSRISQTNQTHTNTGNTANTVGSTRLRLDTNTRQRQDTLYSDYDDSFLNQQYNNYDEGDGYTYDPYGDKEDSDYDGNNNDGKFENMKKQGSKYNVNNRNGNGNKYGNNMAYANNPSGLLNKLAFGTLLPNFDVNSETYIEWRDRCSIDVVIRLIVVLLTGFQAQLQISIYFFIHGTPYEYNHNNGNIYTFNQFIKSTTLLGISVGIECLIFFILWFQMQYNFSISKLCQSICCCCCFSCCNNNSKTSQDETKKSELDKALEDLEYRLVGTTTPGSMPINDFMIRKENEASLFTKSKSKSKTKSKSKSKSNTQNNEIESIDISNSSFSNLQMSDRYKSNLQYFQQLYSAPFNIFEPFIKVLTQSSHSVHYLLLFAVVTWWWIY